jgi:hypothetical protein
MSKAFSVKFVATEVVFSSRFWKNINKFRLYNRYENISAQAERIKIAVPIIAKRKWSRNATRYRDPVPALSKNPVMNMHSPSTRRFENSQITGKFVSAVMRIK